MITICARWDSTQLPCETEYRMYRQLKAFGISRFVFTPIAKDLKSYAIDQYETMEEALQSCNGNRVFLEPTGKKEISEIPNGDIVLVIGNTGENNLKHAKKTETYRLNKGILYGVNAAAIALHGLN